MGAPAALVALGAWEETGAPAELVGLGAAARGAPLHPTVVARHVQTRTHCATTRTGRVPWARSAFPPVAKSAGPRVAMMSSAVSSRAAALATTPPIAATRPTSVIKALDAVCAPSRVVTIPTTALQALRARTKCASIAAFPARLDRIAHTASPVSSRAPINGSADASRALAVAISVALRSSFHAATQTGMAPKNACRRSCQTWGIRFRVPTHNVSTRRRPSASQLFRVRPLSADSSACVSRRSIVRTVSSVATCGVTAGLSACSLTVPV